MAADRASGGSLFVLGSIGMGKSTVGKFFKDSSIPVLEADEVVHALYSRGGAAVEPVGEAFPTAVVDGAISRVALSACVVGKEAAMKQLEALVHPLVSEERKKFIERKAQEGHTLVVLDIPLLYETGSEHVVDAVVVVSAPPDVQQQRVLARPGMTLEKFTSILARQVPDEEKRRRADFILDTALSPEETREHVAALIKGLKGRAGKVSKR